MCREYNGEYKTYIKEDDVASIISALAYKDAFDIDTITSDIPIDTPDGTTMDTTFSVVGAPDSPSGIFAYNYYNKFLCIVILHNRKINSKTGHRENKIIYSIIK